MSSRISLSDRQKVAFAERVIDGYLDPAFGALPKTEIDLLIFSALHEAGAFGAETSPYEAARLLRITPSRLRALRMRMQLRDPTQTDASLNDRIIDAIGRVQFLKEGSVIQFGIEDPLVQEHLAAQLKRAGVFADTSFNREIVKLPLGAFVAFIESLLPEDRRELVRQALIKAGMEDTSLAGVLSGALGKVAEKIAGKAGEFALKELEGVVGPPIKSLFKGASEQVVATWKSVFSAQG